MQCVEPLAQCCVHARMHPAVHTDGGGNRRGAFRTKPFRHQCRVARRGCHAHWMFTQRHRCLKQGSTAGALLKGSTQVGERTEVATAVVKEEDRRNLFHWWKPSAGLVVAAVHPVAA